MGTRGVVNSYTGANVSIFIGDTLITNAFGITWELSAGKRPIFGYNGLHQQAFATGQVMVLGSLYLNFQHPNYLSYVLKKYFELKRQIQSSTDTAEVTARIKNSRANLVNEFRNLRQGETFSPASLNELFNDKAMQAQLIPALTAGELLNVNVNSGPTYNNYKRGMTFDRELSPEEKTQKWAAYARPDQFVGAEDTSDAIDIVVTFGNPGLKDRNANGTATYQGGSGIILRAVNFLGEGMTVMSDDQPVMEVYKFMAASKDYLAAAELSEDDIIELGQYGQVNDEEKARREANRERVRGQIGTSGGLPPGGPTSTEADPGRRGAPVARLPNENPEPGAPRVGLPAEGERSTTTTTPPASAPPTTTPSTPSTAPAGTPAPPIAVEPTDPIEIPTKPGDEP